MRITSSQTRSLKRQGLTILILLASFAAYYALVVPRQKEFFTQRSFRLLAGMGEHIRSAVGLTVSVVTNAVYAPLEAPAETNAPTVVREPHAQRAAQIQSTVAQSPHLRLLEPPSTNVSLVQTGLTLRVMVAGRLSWLEFDATNGSVRASVGSDLAGLIEPIVDRRHFDDVLLLNTTGEVIFQRDASRFTATRLAVPPNQALETNLVEQAGAKWNLYTQPIEISFPPAGLTAGLEPLRWTLCGVVHADRYRTQTRGVNYTVIVVFLFAALLLVFSWPLFNAWSLGPQGALGRKEAVMLVGGALLLLALLTLQVLDLCAYSRLEGRLARELENFSAQISTHFAEELRAASRQLDAMNQYYRAHPKIERATSILSNAAFGPWQGTQAAPHPFFNMVFWADDRGVQVAKWTVKSNTTPFVPVKRRNYFRALREDRAWEMQVDGALIEFYLEPIYSITTGENLAILSKRFTNDSARVAAIEWRLLSLADTVVPPGFGYCVVNDEGTALFHSDESRNLRENFFQECGDDHRLRAAVRGRATESFDTEYLRRTHQMHVRPLPEVPWSLVVFREEQVLATSRVEIALVAAQLCLTCLLLAAALGGVLALLARVFQWEHPLAWIWPNPDRLKTYRATTALNLVLMLLFAVLILTLPRSWALLALVVLLPLGSLALNAQWLSQGAEELGARLPKLAERLIGSWRVGYVATFGLLLSLLTVWPTLSFFTIAFDTELELLVRHAQLQLAQHLETRQVRIQNALKGIRTSTGTETTLLAVQDPAGYLARRLDLPWDIYGVSRNEPSPAEPGRFLFGTTVTLATNQIGRAPDQGAAGDGLNREARLAIFLGSLRPHFNDFDVQTRALMSDAADGRWRWTRDGARLELTPPVKSLSDGRTQARRIVSFLPRLAEVTPETLLWLLPCLAVWALPFIIVWLTARKVLALEVETPAEIETLPRKAGWYLILGPPRSGKSQLLNADQFEALKPGFWWMIDLRRAEDRKWLELPQLEHLLSRRDWAVAVDHFEYGCDDHALTRAKLRFLQELSCDDRRTIIVVSNIHPLHFATGDAGRDDSAGDAPPSEGEAWRDLLASFQRIYSGDDPQMWAHLPAAGQTALLTRVHCRPLWKTCSPAEQDVLHHVARGRLVNSSRPEVRALLRRGLLQRRGPLQICSEPFRIFILANYQPPRPSTAAGQGGLWEALKGPAITVLVLLAAFFFVTQQDVWTKSMTAVAGFAAGLGTLGKLLDLLQRKASKPEHGE